METKLEVKPFLDNELRGVFSTRAPVNIEDVDILDGTPLLDIKPYVDKFDVRVSEKQGWLDSNIGRLPGKTDDGRFVG